MGAVVECISENLLKSALPAHAVIALGNTVDLSSFGQGHPCASARDPIQFDLNHDDQNIILHTRCYSNLEHSRYIDRSL
jgi:Na+/H+ antiporter NhaB